jgi:hypothetical protein
MRQNETQLPQLDRIQRPALIAAAVGLLLCALGAFLNIQQFFQSYLFAYLFWIGIALGCLAITLLHHLVGGGWGYLIRRILEAGFMTLPLMLLLFVPIAIGMPWLYEWTHAEEVAHDAILQSKSGYLNVPFFLARAALYFALWIGVGYALSRWSLQQDHTGDPALGSRMRNLSRAGLALYVLSVSFAAIDWAMSLEPHWFSSIYGVLFMIGQVLSALAFAIVVAALLAPTPQLAELATPDHFNDLGNLLLAFVMFWAYITLSQFLIIWSANLPEEVTWYLRRNSGGWNWVVIFVIAFQFALPLLLLFSRRAKRSVRALSRLAAAIIAVHLIEMFWLIAPAFHAEGLAVHWLDLAAVAGIGGLWIAAFAWLLRRRPLVPLHDPRLPQLAEAAHHG